MLTLECLLSNSHVMAMMPSELKLLVNVKSTDAAGPRPALNLAVVIDRSTSMMEQNKLDSVRTAASYMLQHLTAQDIISVVDFGSDVNVLIPAQPASDGVTLSSQMAKLQAKGATNIYEALRVAGQELAKNAGGSRVHRLLLLSDGIATEGNTTDSAILQVAGQVSAMGAAISTLGVGNDYDETLMNRISEQSGGNHYYVATPDDIAKIFLEEMGRLESVVARNLQMAITEVPGIPVALLNHRYTGSTVGNTFQLSLNEMQKGKTQPIIFGISLPAQAAGQYKLADVKLSYEDVGAPGTPNTVTGDVQVNVDSDPALIRDNINREVLRQWEETRCGAGRRGDRRTSRDRADGRQQRRHRNRQTREHAGEARLRPGRPDHQYRQDHREKRGRHSGNQEIHRGIQGPLTTGTILNLLRLRGRLTNIHIRWRTCNEEVHSMWIRERRCRFLLQRLRLEIGPGGGRGPGAHPFRARRRMGSRTDSGTCPGCYPCSGPGTCPCPCPGGGGGRRDHLSEMPDCQ